MKREVTKNMQAFPVLEPDGAELRAGSGCQDAFSDAFPIMKFFEYGNTLRGRLQANILQGMLQPCAAYEWMRKVLEGPEFSAGLRKLLEAKDCFVRAALDRKV